MLHERQDMNHFFNKSNDVQKRVITPFGHVPAIISTEQNTGRSDTINELFFARRGVKQVYGFVAQC